jgi:hypothetical protein
MEQAELPEQQVLQEQAVQVELQVLRVLQEHQELVVQVELPELRV